MARLFTGLETIENWSPLDDGPEPEFLPVEWCGPHVQVRLTEAWKTLNKMPAGRIKPQGLASAWPTYRHDWADLLNMMEDGKLETYYRQVNRIRILPSAREISVMEAAIEWPWRYLRTARSILIVNVCARIASFSGDLEREIRRKRYKGSSEHWKKLNWKFCDKIADGLIRDRIAVF